MYDIDIVKCSLVRESVTTYDRKIKGPGDVYDLCESLGMPDASEEYLYLFCLDAKGKVIGIHEICHGSVTEAPVNPRDIYKKALLNNAVGIIVAHNHPSGDPTPSKNDYKTTEKINNAGEVLGVNFVDHIVIGDGKYASTKDRPGEIFYV